MLDMIRKTRVSIFELCRATDVFGGRSLRAIQFMDILAVIAPITGTIGRPKIFAHDRFFRGRGVVKQALLSLVRLIAPFKSHPRVADEMLWSIIFHKKPKHFSLI